MIGSVILSGTTPEEWPTIRQEIHGRIAKTLGVAPAAAAEFTFLMGVVAIAGAALRCAPELGTVAPGQTTALLLGSGAALICGIAAIWAFVRTLCARAFHRFAYYTWAAGLLVLLLARG